MSNQLTNKERILIALKEGQRSKLSLRQELNIAEEELETIVTELVTENKIVRYRCKGGGVKLIPDEVSNPEINAEELSKIEAEKTIINEAEAKLNDSKSEESLYPYIERWAFYDQKNSFDHVKIVGNNHRRHSWENPDLIALNIHYYEWLVGHEVIITAFEVKLNFSIYALWQAANYRNFAHQVYLACYEKPEQMYSSQDGRLFEIAMNMGIGIISMSPSGQSGSGVKCTEILTPEFKPPQLIEIDSFLSDYSDLFPIKKPGSILTNQISKLA